MLGSKFLFASLAIGLVGVSALPSTPEQRGFQHCNTPRTRSQWCGNFKISTDSEEKWPSTGQIRKYDLVVSAWRLAPDGNETDVLMINGSIPGPTLYADWGDTFVINVFNNMTDNGTSMHWHGIIQANTTTMDGVNGVTECPIPPGATRQYKFVATQHGTTWYHSHYSGQYGEGVLGAMVINGPASANYDEDLGTMTLTDWFYDSIYMEELRAEEPNTAPPPGPSALINGSMHLETANIGKYFKTKPLRTNTTYRLRLINTAVDNGYHVTLDNHKLTVIAADFVPVKTRTVDWLFIGIGQRYDVVFTTGSTPGNFWFRAAVPDTSGTTDPSIPGLCGGNLLSQPGQESKIKAIFHYKGASTTGTPNTIQVSPAPTDCGENIDNFGTPNSNTPYLTKPVPRSQFAFNPSEELELNSTLGSTTNPDGRIINQWTINDSALTVDWQLPTLSYVRNGTSSQLTDSDHTHLNVYRMPEANKYYFWIIQNEFLVPHPIHLHGHDFFILGSGIGRFTADTTSRLNFENPMRRDVTMLPGNGYLVLAIYTNNPGAWLMHCHIAWHISMGLGVQFLERESELHTPEVTAALDTMQNNCVAWDRWYETTPFKKPDSGLRLANRPRPSTPLLKAKKLKV
ncbi:hypothetical protein HYALB_00001988 [Hymenoscyphus albidus]|uniref:laccase n=1 Tax=Hymenoscyphus albidus TaxID=595503 RepID=A0A9N9LEW4_9HELO|nr:hypothetical protein HYALB_00001988 [Hymenoscyphus albidus]